jgi:Flp pilus assembly protein TadD
MAALATMLVLAGGGRGGAAVDKWSEAQRYEAQGQWNLASSVYMDILEDDPKNAEAAYRLGVVRLRLGADDLARDALVQALALDPQHAGARSALEGYWVSRGLKARAGGNHAAAATDFRAATQANPKSATAWLELAEELQLSGDLDGAIAALRDASRAAPEEYDPPARLGTLLARQGKHAEAVEAFRTAVGRNPRAAETQEALALSYQALGRRDDALAAIKEAIRQYLLAGNETQAIAAERVERELAAGKR